MGERRDLPRLYIAVNPSKLVRCNWCDTVESIRWEHSRSGTFCSTSCQKASEASNECVKWIGFCNIAMMVFFFMIGIEYGVTIGIFVVPVVFWMLRDYRHGKEHALKVPKSSRRKVGLDNFSVVKTMLKHVECPNCDGNIDLSRIGADRIYHCGYCGATGVIKIVFRR